MIKKNNKKAFTLVELLVVIAILAVLSAVAIVGYSSFTKRANISNDGSLIKEVNDYIKALSYTDTKLDTIEDVRLAVKGDTIDFASAKPFAAKSNYHYGFNIKSKQLTYLNEFVAAEGFDEIKDNEKQDVFVFVSNNTEASHYTDNGYSLYLQEGLYEDTLNIKAGLDVGVNSNLSSVNYTNSTSEGKEVVIRTNSASTTLTIDDASTGTIYHYGSVGALNIIQCHTASYHENGKVAYAEIAKGRIVLENGSKVEEIHVNKKTDSSFDTVIIANNGGAEELPERITRDAVEVSSQTLVVKVESNGSSENVYVYANGTTGTTEKVTEGENKQNEAVNSALGQLVLDNGSAGEKAQTTEQKQAAKTDIIETAVEKEAVEADESDFWIVCHADEFASGSGTEQDPYVIKTARQLSLLAYNVNTLQAGYASAYYRLDKNIDLSGKAWTPIGTTNGTDTLFFTGHFDGNGKSIIGLTNNGKSDADLGLYSDELSSVEGLAASYGLFGFTQNVNISDLTMESASIDGPNHFKEAGIIIGMATGSTTMTNCKVDEKSSISGKSKLGGLIGFVNLGTSDGGLGGNVTLTNCDFDGKVTVSADRAGAIIGAFCANQSTEGYNLGHTHLLKDCDSTGTINSGSYGTGLIGFFYQGSAVNTYGIKTITFDNCTANVTKFATTGNNAKYIGRLDSYTTALIIKNDSYATNIIGDLHSGASLILKVENNIYGYQNNGGNDLLPSLTGNEETYKLGQMITNAPSGSWHEYWKTDRIGELVQKDTLFKIDPSSIDLSTGELKYGAGWYDTHISDFSSYVADGYHVIVPETHAVLETVDNKNNTIYHYIYQVVAD